MHVFPSWAVRVFPFSSTQQQYVCLSHLSKQHEQELELILISSFKSPSYATLLLFA